MGQAAAVVDVSFEERYWYPDDGGIVWIVGYQLIDRESGGYLGREAPQLARRGLRVVGVAGAARHHAEALQSEAAAPGSGLGVRRDRDNPHDAQAIAVETADGTEQLGWVPREVAARIADEVDGGTAWSAVALRESRRSPRDPGSGLTMLLARADRIELVERPRSARPR